MNARKRLGELLVEQGVIDEMQLCAALGHQRQWGGKLGQTLVDLHIASEPMVVSALSHKLRFDIANLDALKRGPQLQEALRLVPASLARRHLALPVAATTTLLTVAMADPGNVVAIDELSFRSGRRVKPLIAGGREVERALQRFYEAEYDRPEAIPVDPDVLADAADVPPLDASPARFQERFYSSSLRDWSQGAARATGPQLVRVSAAEAVVSAGPAAEIRAPSPAASGVGLVDALKRMAGGVQHPALPPVALVAAVTTALLRRGLVTEAEVMAELWRAHGGTARSLAADDRRNRP
jgi:type IV pilus assembly protein PilB